MIDNDDDVNSTADDASYDDNFYCKYANILMMTMVMIMMGMVMMLLLMMMMKTMVMMMMLMMILKLIVALMKMCIYECCDDKMDYSAKEKKCGWKCSLL